jgi:hypothetical protein
MRAHPFVINFQFHKNQQLVFVLKRDRPSFHCFRLSFLGEKIAQKFLLFPSMQVKNDQSLRIFDSFEIFAQLF